MKLATTESVTTAPQTLAMTELHAASTAAMKQRTIVITTPQDAAPLVRVMPSVTRKTLLAWISPVTRLPDSVSLLREMKAAAAVTEIFATERIPVT